jgi:hypothetical protein
MRSWYDPLVGFTVGDATVLVAGALAIGFMFGLWFMAIRGDRHR